MANTNYDLDVDLSQFELSSNTGRRTARGPPPPPHNDRDLGQFQLRSQSGWSRSKVTDYFGMQSQSRPRPSRDLSHFELDLDLFEMELRGEQAQWDQQTLPSRDLTLRSNYTTHMYTPAPAKLNEGKRHPLPNNWFSSNPAQQASFSRPPSPPPQEIRPRRYTPSPVPVSSYRHRRPTSRRESSPTRGHSFSPPQQANTYIPKDKEAYGDRQKSKSRERMPRRQSPSSRRPTQNHRRNNSPPLHTFAQSRKYSESSSSNFPEERKVSNPTISSQTTANTIRRSRQLSRGRSQSRRNSPSPKARSQVRGRTASTRRRSHSRANSKGRESSTTRSTSHRNHPPSSRRSSPSKNPPKRTPSPPKPKSILKTQTWTSPSPPKQKERKTKGKDASGKNAKAPRRQPHEPHKSVGKSTVTSFRSMVSSPPVPMPDYDDNPRALFIPSPDY